MLIHYQAGNHLVGQKWNINTALVSTRRRKLSPIHSNHEDDLTKCRYGEISSFKNVYCKIVYHNKFSTTNLSQQKH